MLFLRGIISNSYMANLLLLMLLLHNLLTLLLYCIIYKSEYCVIPVSFIHFIYR